MAINFSGFYYDLLSGEFQPLSDPQGRQHTLGVLAIKTAQDGERIDGAGSKDVRQYRPSWTKNIVARTIAVNDVLHSIELLGPDRQRLLVQDQGEHALVHASVLPEDEIIPLDFAPRTELATRRIHVANLAEIVFNNAHNAA